MNNAVKEWAIIIRRRGGGLKNESQIEKYYVLPPLPSKASFKDFKTLTPLLISQKLNSAPPHYGEDTLYVSYWP